jgi:hypothetical protein
MYGDPMAPIALFLGVPNVKSQTSALERFKTRHVFGALDGRVNRDLFHSTARPHNAFSASAAYCSSVFSSRFSCPAFAQCRIFQAPE